MSNDQELAPTGPSSARSFSAPSKHQDVDVERHFRSAIVQGIILAGERLPPERQIAQDFGVGRTAVRAALARLERDQLVERRLGSGTYITDQGRSELYESSIETPAVSPLDVIETRRAIEPGYIGLVIARATASDLAKMSARLKAVEQAADPIAFKIAAYRFHFEIAKATRNPLIIAIQAMILSARAKAGWPRFVVFNETDEARTDQLEYMRSLFVAIEARDAVRASEILSGKLSEMVQTILTDISPPASR